jgi:rhodanese-related sulfurtransferase
MCAVIVEQPAQKWRLKKHMLKILFVLTMLSTVALAQEFATTADGGNAAHHRPAIKAKQLTNDEFDAYLGHPEKILLIDVRRPDEISSIGGFPVYLNIQIKELKDHLREIPKDREIITVSNHAARASVAADLLADNGFKVLGAVGADTYQKAGGKLAVKFPVPPVTPQGGQPAGADASTNAHTDHPGSN